MMPSSDHAPTPSTSSTPAPAPAPAPDGPAQNGLHAGSSSDNGEDAIHQYKEKAKVVMAAGLQAAAPSPAPPSRQPSKSPAVHPTDQEAVDSPSRKRSRSGSRIASTSDASRPDTNRLLIEQFTSRDQIHSAAIERDQTRARQLNTELVEDRALLDRFRMRRIADVQQQQHTRVMYPVQRRIPWGRRTPTLRVPAKDRLRQAEALEDLVPIRLDLELEKLRLRDTFTWNIHDRVVPHRIFAQGLVEDFHLPPEAVEHFTREVYASMQEQISDFHPHIFLEEGPLDPHLPYLAYKNDDMRIQVKLNITIGPHTLVDQFDWDINNPHNSPEAFAHQMAQDLSLSGEFMTAIAHCIREQSQLFTKGLYAASHPFDGRPVEDSDIRENLLPSPITSAYRPFQAAKEHAPYFYELNEADVERTELAFSREQRQQKRSTNRRGGPSLPDLKERLKTWRTMVVSSVIPGSAESAEKSGIYRVSRSKRKAWNAGRGGDDDDEISGESEDESDPESPVRLQHQYGGTSRTRGMRGAASAAQAAMRAINRSVSPPEREQPPETKQMSRRFGAHPVFEEIDDQGVREGLTLKLKVPRERFRQWWRDWKRDAPKREAEAQRKLALQQQEQQRQMASLRNTPQLGGTPGPTGSMGPPSTPGMGNQALPVQQAGAAQSRPSSSGPGGVTVTPPPGQGPAASPAISASPAPGNGQSAPAPPAWVIAAANELRKKYPEDRFEPIMRRNRDTNIAAAFVPRIKCNDCPGNVYLVEEKDPTLENFETHLKLGKHVQKRQERVKAEAG